MIMILPISGTTFPPVWIAWARAGKLEQQVVGSKMHQKKQMILLEFGTTVGVYTIGTPDDTLWLK